MKNIHLYALLLLGFTLLFASCNKDDELEKPAFSEITISPVKDVYRVGDKVVLKVKMLSPLPASIKAAKYWFYYDYATKAMFVTPTADTQEFTSPQITLTKAGTTELSFWAQFDYPNYQYDGVTRTINIQVEE